MSRFTAIGIVLLFVLSFILINAGGRGTYRSAWAAITAPPSRTPKNAG